MSQNVDFPSDPFGPPLRHLSFEDFEAWLIDFALPQVQGSKQNYTEHHHQGPPFTFFPEENELTRP